MKKFLQVLIAEIQCTRILQSLIGEFDAVFTEGVK